MEIMFINLTEDTLKQKIQDTLGNIACFTSRDVAEKCIQEIIGSNAESISSWLFSENMETSQKQRLKLVYDHQTVVGYGMRWGTEKIVETTKSYIVLSRTEFIKHDEGFLIEYASPLLDKDKGVTTK